MLGLRVARVLFDKNFSMSKVFMLTDMNMPVPSWNGVLPEAIGNCFSKEVISRD